MTLTDNLRLARRLGWSDPRQIAASAVATTRWGPTLAGLLATAATRHGSRVAVVDDEGAATYAEIDRRSTRLAMGLLTHGVQRGDHLGLLCTNHRGFVETLVASAKAGLPAVLLNTGFAGPQLAEVLEREGVRALVCDGELVPVVDASGFAGPVIVADGEPGAHPTLADVRAGAGGRRLRPSLPVAPVLLTSGTTGTPKGARRETRAGDLTAATGFLHRVPYAAGDVSVIPTPLFHAWGLAQLTVAISTGSTAVLVRRFDPVKTLDAVASSRATVLAVVPIMLQRMLALDDAVLDGYDLSSLRIVASSGSALPAQVALDWMDRFGDTLYNMYGSTEVGQATLADPHDLRSAPGTAGRVVPGCKVEIVGADGEPLATGEVGRIVVGGAGQFTEYTGGGTKEQVRGLMDTGDVGYFDGDGRLFVTGRSDDMIVSGGENVFPQEVEEVLLAHPAVADAAVFGVDDAEFGQRLAARVVLHEPGGLDADALRAAVARRLARHKVPRDVEFVDALPRNTTGKLLRGRLTD